jgi:hypothetical protein
MVKSFGIFIDIPFQNPMDHDGAIENKKIHNKLNLLHIYTFSQPNPFKIAPDEAPKNDSFANWTNYCKKIN